MKKFFEEFKKFITRGNVVDMAVGVIVGSSFTAIVNALSNNILKPIINWLLALIFGANSLSEVFTFLKRVDKDILDIEEKRDLVSMFVMWVATAVLSVTILGALVLGVVVIIKMIMSFMGKEFKIPGAYHIAAAIIK